MADFIVRDFQSLIEAKVSIKGFTMIVGETASGKSALFRALYAATHNRFKIGQVRYGEDSAVIKVRYDDSPEVLIVKRGQSGSPSMKLGDQVFSKMARSVPPQVEQFNNFGTLDVRGDDKFSLNFSEQFQKPLLLEYSQKKVMEMLSTSKGLDDLNKVAGILVNKRAENRGAFASVEAILNKNNAALSMLKFDKQSMEEFMNSIDKIEPEYNEVVSSIESLTELHKDYKSLKRDVDRINLLIKIIENIERREELINHLKEYDGILITLNQLTTVSCRIPHLEKVVCLSTEILSNSEQISELQSVLIKLFDLEKSSARLVVVQRITDICEKVSKINSHIKDVQLMTGSLESCKIELTQISVVDEKINSLTQIIDNNICPICGSKLNIEHGLQCPVGSV